MILSISTQEEADLQTPSVLARDHPGSCQDGLIWTTVEQERNVKKEKETNSKDGTGSLLLGTSSLVHRLLPLDRSAAPENKQTNIRDQKNKQC